MDRVDHRCVRALGWVAGMVVAAALSVALVPGLTGAAAVTAPTVDSCATQSPGPEPVDHARQCLVGVSSAHARPVARAYAPLLAPAGATAVVPPDPVPAPVGQVDLLASEVDGAFDARRRGPPPAARP